MDIKPATLVREVDAAEDWREVVNEAKALTWTHRCEHALLRCDRGRLLLVRGGADGLEFELIDGAAHVRIDGAIHRVTLLAWHTHPRPTGPSDHDRLFLRMISQDSSVIYEMFGDGNGTRFGARDPEDKP
jgi:hypothetical protein